MIGSADLLETEVLGPVEARQQEALSRIKASSWHLVGIIDEILTLSRVEAGKEEVRWGRADVAEIAREEDGSAPEWLQVHVDETGPGIAPDHQERVFSAQGSPITTGQGGWAWSPSRAPATRTAPFSPALNKTLDELGFRTHCVLYYTTGQANPSS